ncbi:MAG: HAD hydrolase-like protein, partial [Pseudomonadota bacterium]
GKPQPFLFEQAAWSLKCTPSQCVVIGDNPETDGRGAAALGMPFIQVNSEGGIDLSELVDAFAVQSGAVQFGPVARSK